MIARRVAQGVVYVFEVIQVQTHDCDGPTAALRRCNSLFDSLVEKLAIGQTRKHIMMGQVVEFSVAALQFADVGVENNCPAVTCPMFIHERPSIIPELTLEYAM